MLADSSYTWVTGVLQPCFALLILDEVKPWLCDTSHIITQFTSMLCFDFAQLSLPKTHLGWNSSLLPRTETWHSPKFVLFSNETPFCCIFELLVLPKKLSQYYYLTKQIIEISLVSGISSLLKQLLVPCFFLPPLSFSLLRNNFSLLIHTTAMHWRMGVSPKPSEILKGFWTTERQLCSITQTASIKDLNLKTSFCVIN